MTGEMLVSRIAPAFSALDALTIRVKQPETEHTVSVGKLQS
jgi:hypothetical protein